MPRTLVISDLHLGARGRTAVLEQPAALERLLAALEGYERLVLLGDVVELLEARPARAVPAAELVLREVGRRLGRDREVVLVPGNHDRPLLRSWVRTQGRSLQREAAVPSDATPLLARLTTALAPARMRVSYPGVWLADDVWATHGHYLNRHLFPTSSYGIVRGPRRELPERRVSPWGYERGARVPLSPLMGRLPEPLAGAADGAVDLLRAATMPAVKLAVNDPRFSPLTARLLGMQMRRHSLPAIARVAHELGVQARYVVFGHVHRLGPLADDDPDQWRGPEDGPWLLNTGSWLYEPRLVGAVSRRAGSHPYWPGGAVSIGDDGVPRAVALLGDLEASELRGPATVAPSRCRSCGSTPRR